MSHPSFEIKQQKDGKYTVLVHAKDQIDVGVSDFDTEVQAQAWIDAQLKEQR